LKISYKYPIIISENNHKNQALKYNNGIMKILYIITQGELGGAQFYVRDLSHNIKRQKCQNTVEIAIGENLKTSWLQKEANLNGIKTHQIKNLKREISIISDILCVFELIFLYFKVKPDIIHLNSTKAGLLGSLAGFFYKIFKHKSQIIYTVHGWVFNEPMSKIKNQLYIFLEKFSAIFKDKIICVSDYDLQQGLNKQIAPAKKMTTIHNGLKLDEIKLKEKIPAQQELNLPNVNYISFITIANFYHNKGLNILIEAVELIKKSGITGFKAFIIGKGELETELKKSIAKKNLQDEIILLGEIKNANQYLSAFDIAILPSYKEGLPYFLLEAGFAGLPLIATNTGGIPEIITNNFNGLMFNSGNARELSELMIKMINNQQLREQLASNSKIKIYQEFNFETMFNKTLAIYLKQ